MIHTVLTQFEIEIGIKHELTQLAELNAELILSSRRSAEAESAYKVSFAKARVRARASGKINEATAEDLATIDTETERLANAVAQADLLAKREAIASCKARLDGLRTLASSARSSNFLPNKKF